MEQQQPPSQKKRELPPDLVLKSGAHKSPEDGMCIMEAAAFVAGEAFSDKPACACPIIAIVCRPFNDRIADDARRTAMLKPLVDRLVGSKSTPAVELRRVWMFFDFLARVALPMLCDAYGRKDEAARLRALGEITDRSSAESARDVLRATTRALDLALDLARDRALARALALALALARDLDRALDRALARALALALALARDLDRALDLARDRDRDRALALARALARDRALALALALEGETLKLIDRMLDVRDVD
jgi:hypothetical protein